MAISIGLVDKPGGRKLHQGQIPLVGGVAIYLSLVAAWILLPLLGIASMNAIFLGASGLLFTVGLLDDRFSLSVKLRFTMQIVAALLLVYSNVVLNDFGDLISDELLVTGIFATPVTVIATVGVINSLNMIDGIDGLAGMVSVVILSLLLLVSIISGSIIQALITVCILGSVVGFLIFNMRRPGFKKAKVFMGDAGSTQLGFMFAYLLISLSQGDNRAISPVVGLWMFALPLMDTLGVMIRRIWLKKSPFVADRGHLHHLLMDAGFRVRHVVYAIAAFQLILGGVGVAGYYLGISESISFLVFSIVSISYIYLISRPWRTVPKIRKLHRSLDITVRATRHVYVGNLNEYTGISDVKALLDRCDYAQEFDVFRWVSRDLKTKCIYAVIDAYETDNVKKIIHDLKKILHNYNTNSIGKISKYGIRQYILRCKENDRRKTYHAHRDMKLRSNDRRAKYNELIYSSKGSDRLMCM
jgi:undecaprenyl-phosphate alpha-N-acetylglucosaminyl 1-phosphatetransferase